jgi:putative PIN family toxin of toxin-antitoxin system
MRFLYDTSVLATMTRREELTRFRTMLDSPGNIHVTSEYILAELETVLRTKFGFTVQKARVTSNALGKLCEVVYPKAVEQISRDPLDDYVLAAAFEGRVDYLITADNDLLILESHKGTKILSPDEFKKKLT